MDDTTPSPHISIVIPAFNEGEAIGGILDEIAKLDIDAEIIVINDGSTDNTSEVVRSREEVRVIDRPYNIGYSAALKTGFWEARGDIIVTLDSDGQHRPADIPRLLDNINKYDMVVGARGRDPNSELHRNLANALYNALASYIVGRRVEDLTSGFRAIRTSVARQFTYLLPNGFSGSATLTISLFRAGNSVHYISINTQPRKTPSKVNLMQDGLGFLLIMLRIGTLFAPLKIFLPISLLVFFVGLGYGTWVFLTTHRFTNMPVLWMLTGVLLFMMGLLSEQIALLRMSQAAYFRQSSRPRS